MGTWRGWRLGLVHWLAGWLAGCMRIWAMVEEGPRSGFWEALLTPYAVCLRGLLGRPHDGAFTRQCFGHSTGDGVSAQARCGGGLYSTPRRGGTSVMVSISQAQPAVKTIAIFPRVERKGPA